MYVNYRVWLAYVIFLVSIMLSIYVILTSHSVYIAGVKNFVVLVYSEECEVCDDSVDRLKRVLSDLGGYDSYICIAEQKLVCSYFIRLFSNVDDIVFSEPVAVVYRLDNGVRGVVFNPLAAPSFWQMLRDTESSDTYVSVYYRTDFQGLLQVNECLESIFDALRSLPDGDALSNLVPCNPRDIVVIG